MEISSPSPGLRERKKQKTRDTIIKVALELFAERGYEQTTIAEIADAAEVSPRTIFAYFPSKEDILFCNLPEAQERLAQALRERPEGATALDALRDFIAGSLSPDRNEGLRRRILASDENLLRSKRARFAPFEQLMVEAIAEDLHAGPDDIRPQIVAAALTAAFSAPRSRLYHRSRRWW
jgi:AcrR family transcriptional regulator